MGRCFGGHRHRGAALGIRARIGAVDCLHHPGLAAGNFSPRCADQASQRERSFVRSGRRTGRHFICAGVYPNRLDLVGADRQPDYLCRRIFCIMVPTQGSGNSQLMNQPREAVTTTVELKRDLGLWSAAAIVVGTVIGSGIFIVPQTMIRLVGTPSLVFVVWVAGGLLSLAGALSYAELAAAMPQAGGEYVYLKEGYGPLWAFIYGWTQTVVAKSGSIAILATGFFYYLANFAPGLERVVFTVPLPLGAHGAPLDIRYGQLFGMGLIFFLGVLNYFGVKIGGGVQVAVTVVKVGLILLIVIAGLGWGKPAAPHAAALVHL